VSTHAADSVSNASSNNLNLHISQYSLAAAVAGVSMLALVQPAAGEVVVTKKTIPIPMSPFGMPETVEISMTNNGVNDFEFNLYNDSIVDARLLLVGGARQQNGVIASYPTTNLTTYASILARGEQIGPSANFFSYSIRPLVEGSQTSGGRRQIRGHWGGNPKNHYLGVRFQMNGQTHYGWIRLTVTTNAEKNGPFLSAKITGYAYETVANKPIKAGTAATPTAEVREPRNVPHQVGPSLGMLAAGAEGMPLWRREETLPSR
jgi:hypothetical protein